MADARKINEFTTLLTENFGGELSDKMTDFVTEMLSKFSNEQLDHGLRNLLLFRKYSGFPKIAEILEAIQGEIQSPQELLRAEAEAAFNLVLYIPHDAHGVADPKAVAKLNPAAQFAFRQMGGNTNSWTSANLDFKRKSFIEAYARMADNPQKLQELGYGGGTAKPPLALVAGIPRKIDERGKA